MIRGDKDLERNIHFRFGFDRLHAEWFTGSDDLMAFIARFGEEWIDRDQIKPLQSMAIDPEWEAAYLEWPTMEEYWRACEERKARFDESMGRNRA